MKNRDNHFTHISILCGTMRQLPKEQKYSNGEPKAGDVKFS